MNNKHCCCSKPKKVYTNYCHFKVYESRACPVFDTNLHMTHHYKRVNSAKCVVNTSAPRSHQLRYKNVSNFNSRYSSPTLLSTSERIPSRANSNCEVRERIKCNGLDTTTGERSSSVPPRPRTRRNPNVVPQNYVKTRKPSPKIHDNINTKKIPIRNETPASSTANSPKHNPKSKPDKNSKLTDALKVIPIKVPVPAPRHSFAAPKKPAVQDYEYLQFSLRITEDIIRNDLYTQKEMRRVFSSHIEANRGRLNMTKMLNQIDHLCKELNISKKNSGNRINKDNQATTEMCSCNRKDCLTMDKMKDSVESGSSKSSSQSKESGTSGSTNSSSESSKQNIMNKVIDGQHEITEAEINELSESDLQEVITKILNDDSDLCSVCKKTREPEMIKITDKTFDESTSSFEDPFVLHNNVENFYSASVEDIKTVSTNSKASVPPSLNDSKQNVDYKEFACSCEDDKELKAKNLQLTTDDKIDQVYPRAQYSFEDYDQILNSMLKNYPENIENKELQKRCDDQLKILNTCTVDPICSRKLKIIEVLRQENETGNQILSKHIIKNLELCLLDPTCSGLQPKDSADSHKSDNWSTLDSSAPETEENFAEVVLFTEQQDLCLLNLVCSTKQNTLDVQEQNRKLCLVEPVCPGKKAIGTEQIEKQTSKDLCSDEQVCFNLNGTEQTKSKDSGSADQISSKISSKRDERTNSDVEPATEQNKMKRASSVDLIYSELIAEVIEQTNSVAEPVTEQNESKRSSSGDIIYSELIAKVIEQTNSVAESVTEQNKSKRLSLGNLMYSELIAKVIEQTNSVANPAIEQNKSKDLSSIDLIYSELIARLIEQTSSNVQPATEEQNKTGTGTGEIQTTKVIEQTYSVANPATEQNKKDLGSLDLIYSELIAKVIEQTSSNVQPATEEQNKTGTGTNEIQTAKVIEQTNSVANPATEQNKKDLGSLDLIYSELIAKVIEQTSSNVQPATEEQNKIGTETEEVQIKIIGPLGSSPKKSNEKSSQDTFFSKLIAKGSEQTNSDFHPTTEEQNKSKDLSSDGSVYSKSTGTEEINSVVQMRVVDTLGSSPKKSKEKSSVDKICSELTAKEEENKSKDQPSIDSITSKIKSKGFEQITSDVQPAAEEQNKSKDLSSFNSFGSKVKSKKVEQIVPAEPPLDYSPKTSKENEVSTVDKMDSASSNSIKIDNNTTQTSIAATKKPEPVKSSKSDNTGVFYYYDSSPSSSKKEETINVYDIDNKNTDSVDSKLKLNSDLGNQRKEKDDFISSITRFILNKTFSNVKRDSNYSAHSDMSEELKRKNEEKSDFVTNVEKLINDRTNDLYQYSILEKESVEQSEFTFGFVPDSFDKYRSEYMRKYNSNSLKNTRRKSSVSSKTSDSTFSEGEVISSTNVSSIKKLTHRTIRKSEPEILEHLKKYEQNKSAKSNNNFLKPCVCDYEIKTFTEYDRYVPKFRRSMFFPNVSTQTSSPDVNYKISSFNDNLLSDGEVRNTSSEADDTKTDVSENEISSWH